MPILFSGTASAIALSRAFRAQSDDLVIPVRAAGHLDHVSGHTDRRRPRRRPQALNIDDHQRGFRGHGISDVFQHQVKTFPCSLKKMAVEFYTDRPTLWIPVSSGRFAIFYPEDAHAPLGTDAFVHKIVIKVAVDWR
jgi:hypothetical protein